jgi:lysyl-tRNA synthetase class I
MSQKNIQDNIHEFCGEWGHFVDTENINYIVNNNEPRREKNNFKVLETIYDEYNYYINNQFEMEINDNTPMDNNILIKSKKIDIPNIASTICCTIFLTTFIMFVI